MAESPGATVTCAVCSTTVEAPAPLTWSTSRGPAGASSVCEPCTRRHVRSMEAQLDEEHW